MIRYLSRENSQNFNTKNTNVYLEENFLKILFIANRSAIVNTLDARLQTPLMFAARAGHLEIFRFLLQVHGADPEIVNDNGFKAINLICAAGNFEMFNAIIKHQLRVDLQQRTSIYKKNTSAMDSRNESITPSFTSSVKDSITVSLAELFEREKCLKTAVMEQKANFLAKILFEYGDYDEVEYLKLARRDSCFLNNLVQNLLALQFKEKFELESEKISKLSILGMFFRPHVIGKLIQEYGIERCFFIANLLENRFGYLENRDLNYFTFSTWRDFINSIFRARKTKHLGNFSVPISVDSVSVLKVRCEKHFRSRFLILFLKRFLCIKHAGTDVH